MILKSIMYAIRRLLRTPMATTVAILSLALGIGANSAIFSTYEALMLRPLPVRDPSELVAFRSFHPLFGKGRYISYPLYKNLQSHLSSFSGLAVRSARQLNLNNAGASERVYGEFISENYYEVLGVHPVLGRLLTPADEANSVAVLSYNCWRQRFGGDYGIIGKKIFLDAKPFEVIGVTARDFHGTEIGSPLEVQIPVTASGQVLGGTDRLKQPRISWLEAIGRLKPGVSIDAAKSETVSVYKSLRDPNIIGPDHLQLISAARGISPLRSLYSEQFVILLVVAAGVLLLTCLNVSGFLFARTFARRQENAVLAALGARPFALAGHSVIESLLLSVVGAGLGYAMILPLSHSLIKFFPASTVTQNLGTVVDWRVSAFGVLAALLSALVIGVYPAVWAAFSNPGELLKEGNTIAGTRGAARLGNSLLTAQVAISTMLVFCTVLFVRTAQSLESVPSGFAGENLVFASLDPASSGYKLSQTRQFYSDLLDRLRALPGVLHVGLSRLAPLNGDIDSNTICADTYQPARGEKMSQNVNTISPDYFPAAGIALLTGRDFNQHDNTNSPPVAIINRRMAHDMFGTGSAIGHRIGIGCDDPKQANIEIVGVVSDALYDNLREHAARIAYIPYLQNDENLRLTLNARVGGNVRDFITAIRREVSAMDQNIPVYEVRTMNDQIDQSLWREHLLARLGSFFSLLALILCGLGIYSVLSYNVQYRTKEIGLRLSLGASRASIIALVVRDALRWSGAGLVFGIPLAIPAMQLAAALLYGVRAIDFGTIAATIVTIIFCAGLAAFVPACRALSLNPAKILRFQ